MIIVKPNGGLGNRMRVIHSGLLLAKLQGKQKIKVLWKKDAGLNANFSELFQPVSEFKVEQNEVKMGLLFYASKWLLGFDCYNDERTIEFRFETNYWKKVKGDILFNTCRDFLSHEELGNFYSLFKPVHNIQVKIDDLVKSFTNKTIGVQIRRTDNHLSMSNSKTEDFIDQMHVILKNEPETTFFLTTDDKDLENFIKERFKKSILTQQDKNLGRYSLAGIQSAMVDMYGLSATKYILGSYQSSFGEVASFIGNMPFVAISSTENPKE